MYNLFIYMLLKSILWEKYMDVRLLVIQEMFRYSLLSVLKTFETSVFLTPHAVVLLSSKPRAASKK